MSVQGEWKPAFKAVMTCRPAHGFNPKTEIEPQSSAAQMAELEIPDLRQITRIDTDDEEVAETIFKPVWCILKSDEKSNESPLQLRSSDSRDLRNEKRTGYSLVKCGQNGPVALCESEKVAVGDLPRTLCPAGEFRRASPIW